MLHLVVMLKKKEEVVKLFEDIKSQWGEIDFVVHAVAFSDKSELSGEYLNTVMSNSFGFGGTNAALIFEKV